MSCHLDMSMFQVIRIYKDKEHVEFEFTVSQLRHFPCLSLFFSRTSSVSFHIEG